MAKVFTINIDELNQSFMKEKCKISPEHSIYRIPSWMKDQNPTAYTPQLVSIGPYHHGAGHLAAMEEHKKSLLSQFLNRRKQPLEAYCDALQPFTDWLMESYQQLEDSWKSNRKGFIELMVQDGSFLIEYFTEMSNRSDWNFCHLNLFSPHVSLQNVYTNIIPDILMMENQIPLVVIERIIAVNSRQLDKKFDEEAHKLVLKFLFPYRPPSPWRKNFSSCHVLDVFRRNMAWVDQPPFILYKQSLSAGKSASKLLDVGVQFQAAPSELNGANHISFESETLTLPVLNFDGNTEPLFLNAIAYESLHPESKILTSYVAFMRGIIRSAEDVGILVSHGLIRSSFESDEDVLNMMNKISENAKFDTYSPLQWVRQSLDEYCAKKMKSRTHRLKLRMKLLLPRWWHNLLDIHLKTPCTILSSWQQLYF